MRDYDIESEQRFLALFKHFINLERKTDREYISRDFSLRRMNDLAALVGHPERHLQIVHIAGTKGKGSTALMLGAMIEQAGAGPCGIFTSPHLLSVRERFLVDQQPLSYELIIGEADNLCRAVLARGWRPNFFEVMTVLALRLMVVRSCRYAVVETGIGGLLDATNYIPSPQCCIITAISFDHTNLLGRTIAAIAAQKAGIIKPGVPVVVGRQPYPRQALPVIEAAAAARGAPVHYADSKTVEGSAVAGGLAPMQQENLTVAATAARLIGLQPDFATFQMPELPGRCQVVSGKPLVVVDGAHNPDSARRLVEALGFLYPDTPFTVVLGVVEGKDCPAILQQLSKLPGARFILTNPRPFKPSALAELVAAARQQGLSFEARPEIDSRTSLPDGQNLLFTGSFFTAVIGAELFQPE